MIFKDSALNARQFFSLLVIPSLLIGPNYVAAQSASAPAPAPPAGTPVIPGKATASKRKLAANVDAAWDNLADGECKASPPTAACANKAVLLVGSACANSALLFQRGSTAWAVTGFIFVVASAAFTGIGASTTLAQAKVFSTLGGTTGLGAVTANIKGNATTDQAGMTSVSNTQVAFQKFLQTGGAGQKPPSPAEIYPYVATYAYQCVSAATGSPASGNTAPAATTSADTQKPQSQ